MPKDYYLVLGISREASLDQIKNAFRNVAKAHHPDMTHSKDSERFRQIQEAYETLADVKKRKAYDSELKRQERLRGARPVLRATHRRSSNFQRPNRFPSFADEFFSNFLTGSHSDEVLRPSMRDLHYEVILSPSEAHHGGLFPIHLPTLEKCSPCQGSGVRQGRTCRFCNGSGGRTSESKITLSIPPRTQHGTRATLSLDEIQFKGTLLHLVILVDPLLETFD